MFDAVTEVVVVVREIVILPSDMNNFECKNYREGMAITYRPLLIRTYKIGASHIGTLHYSDIMHRSIISKGIKILGPFYTLLAII